MQNPPATLGVQVSVGSGADAEEIAEATAQLRRELLELDVGGVEPARAGDAPPGTKAIELVALGTLLVNIAASELISGVVAAVRAWLTGHDDRTVKLEIDGDVLELSGLSTREQRRLTDEWLRRRTGAAGPAGEAAASAAATGGAAAATGGGLATGEGLATRGGPATGDGLAKGDGLAAGEGWAAGPGRGGGSRHALIVASYDYQDPGLRRLAAPARDAEAFAGVLRDSAIGGFEVRTMLNEPAHVVSEAVEDFFADRSQDDLLLLYFSCHGVKDEGGELFFATSNTKLRRLGATAVAADFVNRRMNRSRSRRIVLFLDCCYAGAFERGMVARAGTGIGIEEHFGGRGHAVITASSALEYAFEGDDLADQRAAAPSVFTGALVEGLETGDADRDQDGYVALDELYDYVYDRVRDATPHQTPGKWAFAVQGDLYIARRSRPVTTPAPLPSELQQAIEHPIAGIRAGGVAELERLLRSRHAGLALAARLALERLADDDSRAVSAAAGAALAKAPATEPVQPAREARAEPVPRPLAEQVPEPVAERAPETIPEPIAEPAPEAVAELVPEPAVEPAPQPVAKGAPETVREPVAEPAPEPVAGAAPEPAPEPVAEAAPEPAPEPVAEAAPEPALEPVAETSTPVRGRAGVAAGFKSASVVSAPEQPVAATPPRTVRMSDDRLLMLAGSTAIVGAVLLLLSLVTPTGSDTGPVEVLGPRLYVIIMSVVMAGAGIATLVPSRRRLIGPGVLLGAAGAASMRMFDNAFLAGDVSLALDVLAHVVLVVAACLAGFAVARSARVRLVPRALESVWARLVLVLGLAGAVAFFIEFFHDVADGSITFGRAPLIWGPAMALAVPALAAIAVPRRFSAALICGWVAGGAALCVLYLHIQYEYDILDISFYYSVVVALAYPLLALLVGAMPFPGTAPIVGWSGCGAALVAAYLFLTDNGEHGDKAVIIIAGITLLALVLVAIPLLRRNIVLGWAAGSAGIFLLYFAVLPYAYDRYYSSLAAFGATLLALLLVVTPFARSDPGGDVIRSADGGARG